MRRSKVWVMTLAMMLTLTREMISRLVLRSKKPTGPMPLMPNEVMMLRAMRRFSIRAPAPILAVSEAPEPLGFDNCPEPPLAQTLSSSTMRPVNVPVSRPWLESSMKLPRVMPLRAPPVRVFSVTKMSLDGPAIWMPPQARYLNSSSEPAG